MATKARKPTVTVYEGDFGQIFLRGKKIEDAALSHRHLKNQRGPRTCRIDCPGCRIERQLNETAGLIFGLGGLLQSITVKNGKVTLEID